MKILFCIIACSLFSLAAIAEPARKAQKEFDSFRLITGFYKHFDKDIGFEFRILEVDGSATVAMDPIYLYLVVTNNSFGDDLQSTIVTLPKVSAIKQVRFFEQPHKIKIEVFLDRIEGGTVPATIDISVPIKGGQLPEVIDTSVNIKKKEK